MHSVCLYKFLRFEINCIHVFLLKSKHVTPLVYGELLMSLFWCAIY